MEAFEILKIAANALNQKKAKEMVALRIENLTTLGEYFLICTAGSTTQLRALCDEAEDKLKENGVLVNHIEGKSTGWVCLDYGSVIIHIFTRSERDYYGLVEMWKDSETINLEEILTDTLGD